MIAIREMYEAKGYSYFTSGDFNLNIFLVRSRRQTDKDPLAHLRGSQILYDDIIGMDFKVNGKWKRTLWSASIDPGSYYLENFFSGQEDNGCAILAEGQYRGAWSYGLHRGEPDHPALIQVRPVKIHRDINRDNILNTDGPTEEGLYGINIHGPYSLSGDGSVGIRSAGCPTFEYPDDHKEAMSIVDAASRIWGPRFTATVFVDD